MTTLNTHFIYCPRSGDRVFVEKPGPEIVVFRWRNGCRHVVGGIRLKWEACGYKRAPLRRLLRDFVGAVTGIAWDDRGTISAVVPFSVWSDLHDIVKLAVSKAEFYDDHTLVDLWRIGAASFASDGGLTTFVDGETITPLNPYAVPNPDEVRPHTPESWVCESIRGGRVPHECDGCVLCEDRENPVQHSVKPGTIEGMMRPGAELWHRGERLDARDDHLESFSGYRHGESIPSSRDGWEYIEMIPKLIEKESK